MNQKELLDKFGLTLVSDLQKSLLRKGVETNRGQNSRLGNSIKFFHGEKQGNPLLVFKMADYWKYVEDGRKADSKPPPSSAIKPWLKRKGINAKQVLKEIEEKARKARGSNSLITRKTKRKPLTYDEALTRLSFIYARSIGKKGTIKRFGNKGAHFYQPIVDDGRIEKLERDLSEMYKKEIKISLL